MYCTVLELIAAGMPETTLAQLSNDANPNVINEDVVEKALSEASEIIDSHIMSRYSLPLTKSHAIIKDVCLDVCKHKLYKRRNAVDESIQKSYDAALATLQQIKKGDISLDEPQPTVRRGFYKHKANEREFPADLMNRRF